MRDEWPGHLASISFWNGSTPFGRAFAFRWREPRSGRESNAMREMQLEALDIFLRLCAAGLLAW